ncbi:MAG: TIR domain-containing protein [Pseudomonadota bacterium]
MADIFVSYAREDHAKAKALVGLLEDQGWSVWWDREIGPGSAFSRVIEEEIEKARCVLVLWTSHSVASEWVNAEASEGLARRILIPVLLEGVRVPLVFRQMQASDLTGWPGRARPEEIASLLNAVGAAIDRPVELPAPRRITLFSLPVLTIASVVLVSVLGYFYQRYLVEPGALLDTPAGESTLVESGIDSAASAPVSVLVTPFQHLPEDISEEIATLLARAPRLQVRSSGYAQDTSADAAAYSLHGVHLDGRLAVSLYDNIRQQTRLKLEIDLATTSIPDTIQTIVRRVSQEFGQAISLNEPDVGNEVYLRYLALQARAKRQLPIDERREVAARLQALVDDSPRFAEAVAGLCSAYLSIYALTRDVNDFGQAERNCIRAARLDSNNPWVDIAMGDLYRVAGQQKEAAASYRKSLETSGYLTPALVGLARLADRDGDPERARTLILQAQSYEPDNWRLFEALGAIYFKRGNYAEAASQYRRVATLTNDQPFALNDLGSSYFMMAEFERAITEWEKSVAAEPNYAAYSNLGSAYFFARRFDLALTAYQKASQINDKDYRMWLNSGEAAHYLPNEDSRPFYQKAVQLAKAAWRVNPDAADVLSALALAHASLGDKTQARDYIAEALQRSRDIYVLYDVAVAFRRLGEQGETDALIKEMVASGYSRVLIEQDANFSPREQISE